jgi:tight adherence protein B
MPFEIDQTWLIYLFAAASVVLFVEAIYLLCFSSASYRSTVNRRLRLMKDQPNRENVLIQLRRERGLSTTGLYGMPMIRLNRLILQSGLTIGFWKLAMFAGVGGVLVFSALWWVRGDLFEAGAVAVPATLLLPYVSLVVMRKRRHARFGEQFPEAIDVIVRSLRAGHPVPIAVSMVAREMPDPVGTEFGIVTDEITYGAALEATMRNLAFRVGQEDLPLFVTAVAIQGSTGGNLSEILENLSSVIRQRFKMRRKIKALASEARFSAFFLSGLPIALFLLLKFVAPDHYGSVWMYDQTKIGLGLTGAWMLVGNIVMFRMVNFKI